MWKDSFTGRMRVFVALFMLLVIINAALVISSVNSFNDITQIKSDIQNIEYIFLFIIFLFSVMLFFYIPLMLNRKIRKIHKLLREVTEGNYYPEIDLRTFDQDKEFLDFVTAIQKMLQVVVKFDQLKAEKITEHNNRILGLLNLAANGFIVAADSGDIIYANDLVKDNFTEFKQNTSFFDDIFSPEIEKYLKPYVVDILHSGSKGKDLVLQFDYLKSEITVKSHIVRDEAGEPIGAILALYNLPGSQLKAKPRDN